MNTSRKLDEIQESAYHLYLQTEGSKISRALIRIILNNVEDIRKILKEGTKQ